MKRTRGLLTGLLPVALFACIMQACGSEEPPPPFEPTRNAPAPKRWVTDVDPVTGSVDLMLALDPLPPTVVNGDYERAARAFIDEHKDALKLTDPRAALALVEVAVARDGTGHVSFSQREGGVRVDGVIIRVHFRRDGSVTMLTGPTSPDAGKTNLTPAVTEAAAIAAAEADLRARLPALGTSPLGATPTPTLVLVPEGAGAKLAWKLRLSSGAGHVFSFDYYVDAQTSAVMKRYSAIALSEGSGTGVLGDTKTFNIREMPGPGGRYAMYQGGVPGAGGRERIVTHAWTGEDTEPKMIRSDDRASWDVVDVGGGSAVDAHRYTADVAEWFRTKVGWSSYDGRGSPLKNVVHDNRVIWRGDDGSTVTNRENAFWDGEGTMHYGDGTLDQGGDVKPTSCALDVIGHELMHGVTQHTSGLVYQGEPGALNEALSDIFGTFIEETYAPVGSALFSIGEAAFPDGGIRDFVHPWLKDQPDHMRHLTTGPGDNGGVHANSGIINNAWYLMTWGGTNDTSDLEVTESIGMDASRRLWWHTSRYLLRPDSTFDRAARAQTAWASSQGMPLRAVACAWVATGVLTEEYVTSSYEVRCTPGEEDAGVDAGADAGPDPEGLEPELFDSCKGRADGVYCSQLAPYGAIVCQGEAIAAGQQCANEAKCVGPNGPGATVQCEGSAPAPPAPPDDNAPMLPDSCDGRPDGTYCSSLAPFSAYQCEDGSIAGGVQCPDEKTCAGPNGPGELVCR